MAEFTYIIPNEREFLKAVVLMLPIRGLGHLSSIFQNAKCEINPTGSYSRVRWNAYYTTVNFRLPIDDYQSVDLQDNKLITVLVGICNELMPTNAGYDVMEVEISPYIDLVGERSSLSDELDEVISDISDVGNGLMLPKDIKEKGQQMAEAYLFLYIIENFLRLFFEKVLSDKFGPDYLLFVTVPKSIQSGIEQRKNNEKKNLWISVRGNSDLFYFDFKDLGLIIQNNWDIFKDYFPDQAWICSKIEEMGNCRNLVAHNSLIGDHERDLIKVYFRSITKQLSSHV